MKQMIKKPWVRVLSVVLALTLILGGAVLVESLMDPMDRKIAQGVTVGGMDVSGMTRFQAYSALKNQAKETILQKEVTVSFPEESKVLSPEETSPRFSAWKAMVDAYRVGRREGADTKDLGLMKYLKLDEAPIQAMLESYAAKYNTNLTQHQWKLRGQAPDLSTASYAPEGEGQTVELTLGLPDRKLDIQTVREQILEVFDQGLTGNLQTKIEVPSASLPEEPDLQKIYDTCRVPASDDSLDLKTYQLVPGTFGYHFDMEKAREMVKNAQYGETISIPMEAFAPEIYAEGVYFREVLGDCETKHNTDENRNTNLRILCEILDGHIVQPGEEFSYNAVVGERTPERGFMPATVYSGDRKSKDYGGGVCQGSTTLYNCLLEADMDITARYGHGALVTYIPLGLDAAVNWSTNTDLAFINNSHFPVKIQAEVSDGYVKMKLLGTDEKDYYIKMEANSYKEGDYYYAASYKCRYDKKTDELIDRKAVAYSTYIAELGG